MNFLIFSFILILFKNVNAFFYNDTIIIQTIKSDLNYRNYYNPFLNQSIDFLNYLSVNKNVNNLCKKSLKIWINGIQDNELWALKLLESTGKTVNGKLNGRNSNFGSFDYCYNFRRNSDIDFDGRYCLVSVHSKETEAIKNLDNYKRYQSLISEYSKRSINFNIGNTHGLCMPSTCSIDEITLAANKLIKPYDLSILPPQRCATITEPEPLTKLQIISFLFLLAFFLLSILSLFIKNNFLSNFSIVNNFNAIYSDDNKSNLALDYAKFILAIGSISFHMMGVMAIYFSSPNASVKEIEFPEYFKNVLGRIVLVGDQMFFVGGFFVMYAWHDGVKTGKLKYNLYYFFIPKYLRIITICLIVILISFLLPILSNGPLYSDISNHLYQNCRSSSWRIFLLISNYQPAIDMCQVPVWYLTAEFQIYLINYFVIYYLIMKPKIGLILTLCQTIVISLSSLIYVYYNNINANINTLKINHYDMYDVETAYFSTHMHYTTYVSGLLCAWLVKNKVKPKILNSNITRILISIIAFLSSHYTLVYLSYLESSNIELNKYVEFFWPAITKLTFNFGFFWLSYLFLIDKRSNKNLTTKLTSLKIFTPFSRLGYSLTTSQWFSMLYLQASTRTVLNYDLLTVTKDIIFANLFIFVISNLIFIFYEKPIHNLLDMYAGMKKRRDIVYSKTKDN